MTTWMERAKAHFLQERQEQADKTDETPLSSVSSVCSSLVCEKSQFSEQPTFSGNSHRFLRKGVTRERAERIVKMLAQRDATLDDRRSCAECVSYYAGRCLKRMQPIGDCNDIADVLHRCAGFSE